MEIVDNKNIYVKTAGLTYIIVILLGIFSVFLIDTNIVAPGNDFQTFKNIIEKESLFRIGVASEIVMYLLVIILSVSLFIILKNVDKNLALIALVMRCSEAIIGIGTILFSAFVPLQMTSVNNSLSLEQIQILNSVFLSIRGSGLDIVLLFIGVGGTIYCYLFFKSNYVPKFLAGWGIFTYLSMFLIAFSSIIMLTFPEILKMIFFIPGSLFEIFFGLWLFVKGINIKTIM